MQRAALPRFDPASLVAAAGKASYARGAQYALHRAVVQMWWDCQAARTARDGARQRRQRPHDRRVLLAGRPGSQPEFEHGECSCPAGFNCKHAVALVLTAADRVRAGRPPPAPRPSPRAVAWEQSLESLLEPRPGRRRAGQPGESPLAIELTLSGGRTPGTGTRPGGERAAAEDAGPAGAAGQERRLGRRRPELGQARVLAALRRRLPRRAGAVAAGAVRPLPVAQRPFRVSTPTATTGRSTCRRSSPASSGRCWTRPSRSACGWSPAQPGRSSTTAARTCAWMSPAANRPGPLMISDGDPGRGRTRLVRYRSRSSAARATAWSTSTGRPSSRAATPAAGASGWPSSARTSRRSCSGWRWRTRRLEIPAAEQPGSATSTTRGCGGRPR